MSATGFLNGSRNRSSASAPRISTGACLSVLWCATLARPCRKEWVATVFGRARRGGNGTPPQSPTLHFSSNSHFPRHLPHRVAAHGPRFDGCGALARSFLEGGVATATTVGGRARGTAWPRYRRTGWSCSRPLRRTRRTSPRGRGRRPGRSQATRRGRGRGMAAAAGPRTNGAAPSNTWFAHIRSPLSPRHAQLPSPRVFRALCSRAFFS
jgi:hypothetical protein